MKMLSKAVASRLENFVAPKRGEGFEDLCLDVFEHVLSKQKLPIIGEPYTRIVAHGVSGDEQGGVDIYDPATRAAAQCKNQKKIHVSHLEEEVRNLQRFGKPVAHYFFLLARDAVPKTLQEWVDKTNQRSASALADDTDTEGAAGAAGPMLHIMGWSELKGHLFARNFLMWKWGVAHPVIHQYPYLPTLDVSFLAETMDALRNKLNTLPNRRDSKDAVVGLLRSVNPDGLINLVSDSKVEREVFDGLQEFVDEFWRVYRVAKTYSVAVSDVDSRDPIIMEQGFALMNDLARHLPRISVLRYLLPVCRASETLLGLFGDEDSYAWEQVVFEQGGLEFEDDGNTTMKFNFDSKRQDWDRPYYVDPEHVAGLIKRVVEGVERARQEAAE